MSQGSTDQLERDAVKKAQSPHFGIGIIATGEHNEALFRTVLRATRADFTTLVVPDGLDTEAKQLVRQLGGTVVETIERQGEENPRQLLVDAAESRSLDGIALCEAGDEIDFEACQDALVSPSTYAITAPTQPNESSTERLVGIPAYNESVGIGSTILAAQQVADEVVVIDDGSSDNTVAIARETEATVLEHEENKGKGYALQTFLTYARTTEYETFVILDGDGQHLPTEIPAVAEPVEEEEADLVVGSRYLEDSPTETPFHRRFGQQVLDVLTLGSSGRKLSDTQSGFRAFSPTAVDRLSIRTDGMGVESEMIGNAIENDLEIEEVPIDVRYEGIDGQTFNPLRHGLSVATFILKMIRDRHPLMFFGLPGIMFTVAGIALGVDAVLLYNSQGAFAAGQTLVSIFLTIIGVLGVFCGLVLNRMSNMISELKEVR
ncbi:glycosyltransferase family 2 protein [Halobacteria archaeon AArc-m2/3/4]|uniref:Glycosyltransferase family 2 protein n=1 Tax=Natronoglomus mannanivorans TaxID=2979990 RepID=A0ABT2QKJ2_9EURY|nr:glycosyltransferase family 2 protein [Halobacteria archaeon AArc-m2/3/4]